MVADLSRVVDSWGSFLNLHIAIVLGVGFDPSLRRKTRWLGLLDLVSHRSKVTSSYKERVFAPFF